MTHPSPEKGWAARGAEATLLPVDSAYLAALNGDVRLAHALSTPQDQQTVFATVGQFIRRIPSVQPLSSRKVARNLIERQGLADIHLAAEKLGGLETRGEKTMHTTAKAVGAAVIVPELASSVLGTVLHRAGMHIAAKASDVATTIFAAPRASANFAASFGDNRLVAAARRFVLAEYDVSYHTAEHLVPFLWASLLRRLAYAESLSDTVLGAVAGRFLVASSMLEIHGDPEETVLGGKQVKIYPPGVELIWLRQDLTDRNWKTKLRDTILDFDLQVDTNQDLRQEKLRLYNKTEPSKRPAGEWARRLQRNSSDYLAQAEKDYEFLCADAVLAQQAIEKGAENYDAIAGIETIANIIGIAWERQHVRDGQEGLFAELFNWAMRCYSGEVVTRVMEQIGVIERNHAPAGLVRAADHIVRYPNFWSTTPDERISIRRALTKAAFDWYDQPQAIYKHQPRIIDVVRRAHLVDITQQGSVVSSPQLSQVRASFLLEGLPRGKGERNRFMLGLPGEVQRLITMMQSNKWRSWT